MTKKLVSEFLGTTFLLALVVGSGIMGDRLASGNVAIALLANSIATGLGLIVLISVFGPISGAHFNPIVTIISYFQGHHSKKEVSLYFALQLLGAFVGVFSAHLMFGEPVFQISPKDRGGINLMFSEFIATFGLIMTIRGIAHHHKDKIAVAVGSYIAAAYWFTSSTSFANPVVTIARAFTATFAGINPSNVLGFILAQILGALAAEVIFRWLLSDKEIA
ncbi:aquaporin family protein [Bdellovibrio sp. qaytius]|nr:aquaporin family protein [Bdellovibrio sp. qaytius]